MGCVREGRREGGSVVCVRWGVCACMCVCVFVCGRERECVCVCVSEWDRGGELLSENVSIY